jgi:rhodanese-related sulfurtransferase
VAQGIVKAGYSPVLVLDGGIAAWEKAGNFVEKGTLTTKIAYTPKPKTGEISVDNFKKIIAGIPADTIVIDVRSPDEVKEGSIPGAVNIPSTEIDQHLGRLPKDKKIVAYCNSGTLAEMAYHTLKSKGYTNIFFLNAKVEVDEGKVEITK